MKKKPEALIGKVKIWALSLPLLAVSLFNRDPGNIIDILKDLLR